VIETIIQVLIVVLSAGAVWFVGRKEKWSRWGYILGLTSQPFWIYTTTKNSQWGLLILSLFYAYSWSVGIYNYWIKSANNNINNN